MSHIIVPILVVFGVFSLVVVIAGAFIILGSSDDD